MAAFATSSDLATRLKRSFSSAESDQADLLLAGATAEIRSLTGQWISEVADDVYTTDAPLSRVLWLPERPVTSVLSVTLDGEAVTDFRRRGSRLIRTDPWATCEGVELVAVYSHGYSDEDERFDLARSSCMAMAGPYMSNAKGLKQRTIDDYTEVFGDSSQWEYLGKALCKQYGKRPRTGSVDTSVRV
jgi:hypothetical protein